MSARSRLRNLLGAVLTTAVAVLACGDDPATAPPASCSQGPSSACVGAGGCAGVATCTAAGVYGPCTCAVEDAGAPPDADVPQPDAGKDADAVSQSWGKNLGDGTMYSVAVDASQNVAVAGFSGGLAYMAKFDAAGAPLWQKLVGSGTVKGFHVFHAVVFDGAGNLYATGYDFDKTDLGGGNQIGAGGYVVKYDASGAFVWAFGPFSSADLRLLAVKSNGNLLLAGTLTGTVDFGAGNVSTQGGNDVLVVELTSSKAFVRAKAWGDAGSQTVTALAVDANDDIFLAGQFDGQIDFGGGALSGPAAGSGLLDDYIVKLDANAGYLHQLETKTAATSSSRVNAIAANAAGDLYVGGTVSQSVINLGGSDLVSAGSTDAVVGMLDANLGHVWSKRFGDSSSQSVVAVATDPTGAATFTGGYGGALDFGFGNLPSPDGTFLVRFDETGTALAAFGSGSGVTSSAYPGGVAFLTAPDYVVVGRFFGTMNVPSGPLQPGSQGSSYLARLAP